MRLRFSIDNRRRVPVEATAPIFLREILADEILWPLRSHQGGLKGYIDRSGAWVCPPLFEDAHLFRNGRAAAKIDGEWGLINRFGEWLIAPYFDWIDPYGPGPVRVRAATEIGFFDAETGNWLVNPRFAYASSFSCGLSHVLTPGDSRFAQHGYVNQAGGVFMLPHLENAGAFSEGRALARTRGPSSKVGYIDGTGVYNAQRWAVPPKFDDGINFIEGLASVRLGERWGSIEQDGSWAIPPKFSGALAFREGMSRAYADEEIGFVNKQGEWVAIVEGVDVVLDCYDGIFPAAVNDPAHEEESWGYMSLSGRWIAEPRFMVTMPFHEGLGEVRTHRGRTGFMDINGDWVIEPEYSFAWFEHGLIYVRSGGEEGYLDVDGNPLTFRRGQLS
jgi:hypothetical protein